MARYFMDTRPPKFNPESLFCTQMVKTSRWEMALRLSLNSALFCGPMSVSPTACHCPEFGRYTSAIMR